METSAKQLPTFQSQARCAILLVIVCVIYLMDNLSPTAIRSSAVYACLIKPSAWMTAAILVLRFRRIRPHGKVRLFGSLMFWTTFLGFGFVFTMFAVGFLEGFGKSPYDHSLSGMVQNLFYMIPLVAGRELVRAYVINSQVRRGRSKSRGTTIPLLLTLTLLFTLTNLLMEPVKGLKTVEEATKYFGEEFLPELAVNALATYLAYMGGAIPAMIYIGIQQCFYWFCPILPNPNWIIKAMFTTVYPIFTLMVIQYVCIVEAKQQKRSSTNNEKPFGWIVVTVVSIGLLWFATGVFPLRPYIIATGSMEPLIYPGDMVIVQKAEAAALKVGDIIQYKRDRIYIFHRLIEVITTEKGKKYRAKGDNNSVADPELIKPENIKGKVVLTVPKIGWPTLILKRDDSVDRSTVEL